MIVSRSRQVNNRQLIQEFIDLHSGCIAWPMITRSEIKSKRHEFVQRRFLQIRGLETPIYTIFTTIFMCPIGWANELFRKTRKLLSIEIESRPLRWAEEIFPDDSRSGFGEPSVKLVSNVQRARKSKSRSSSKSAGIAMRFAQRLT